MIYTRLIKALQRAGIQATPPNGDRGLWTIRSTNGEGIQAEILLPPDLPLEIKAVQQLLDLACVTHPNGGHVSKVCASPDFHPGDSGIAIGSIVASDDLVIPQAIGTDINCGMRLHLLDVSLDRFLEKKALFVDAMKGDYFFGTRDVTMRSEEARALVQGGLPGWLLEHDRQHGQVAQSDWDQLLSETDKVHWDGSLSGSLTWAPEHLLKEGLVRDGGLATIGGGNHFVEVLMVDQIMDKATAYQWAPSIQEGQLAFMVHSGSRMIGKGIGKNWFDRAKGAWPKGVSHPTSGIFPLSRAYTPELVASYLEAEATASNYGFLNRMLLAECMRLRIREIFGSGVEAPLVYDIPHNVTVIEDGRILSRKGACPARDGHPVIIPGSMGTASYLLKGLGSDVLCQSASHGAGRMYSRQGAMHRTGVASSLEGVECITLREERRIEEAPAAYKPIQPVIESQVQAGIVSVVARMTPLLTFKG